ncbi:hypothetical protein DOY81_003768 [Sarcophaga bullata]|nr:hypothetical protein DOY81_003768 [Sarcophaga bullata]
MFMYNSKEFFMVIVAPFGFFNMNKKSARKTASKWDQSAERALLEVWSDMMPRLRGCRKNSHILMEMASELEMQGFNYTVEELKTKMHNMTTRYRKEKSRMGTGGSPTDWDFFNDMENGTCQLRCKSLRYRFAKINAENCSTSSSGAEVEQNQRQYYRQMERLREHMKPQERIIKSESSQQSLLETKLDESNKDAPSSELLEEDRSQSFESLGKTSVLDAEPMFFTEHIPTTASRRKRPKYQADDETFIEFLNKMTRILETRFSVPVACKKEIGPHEGFFAMVQEIFNEMPSDVVRNAKFVFINYLRDQMEAIKEK